MAEWERTERHQVVSTGPAEVDAVEMIRALHEAISEYHQLAGEPPNGEVPPGAVLVRAGGQPLDIVVEHRPPAGPQPVEAPDTGEVPGDG